MKKLITDINQFLLDNEVSYVCLKEVKREFETSTGTKEGEIEIIGVARDQFTYTPAGHPEDEFEDYLEVLSEEDLNEILSSLDDWKTDRDRTLKRCSN